jgi:hypothetical protein
LSSCGETEMQTQIDYVISDPVKRKPEKVIVRYAGTENTINKAEVAGKVTEDMLKA